MTITPRERTADTLLPSNPHWNSSSQSTVYFLASDLTLINGLVIRKLKGIANANRNKGIVSHREISLAHFGGGVEQGSPKCQDASGEELMIISNYPR